MRPPNLPSVILFLLFMLAFAVILWATFAPVDVSR